MNGNLSFLYCFDSGYNKQALVSIISLLDTVSESIEIHIIHNTKHFKKEIPSKIFEHKNLLNIYIYEFKDKDYNFPNIKNSHLTEATYYRLFIENYLPEHLNNILFIDADTVCLNNPIEVLRTNINELNTSKFLIAARTEHKKEPSKINEIFLRLDIEGPYFNAGIMLIDLRKWKSQNFQNKLIKNLIKLEDKILQWDQDVLNHSLNSNYLELSDSFNYNAINYKKFEKENIYFLHYIGSKKPWLTSGIFTKASKHYHENYRKIFLNDFHIIHKWKKQSVVDVLNSFKNFSFFNLDFKIKFLVTFFKSLYK